MSNTDYSYIVGRVRALETQLLNQTLLERVLDAKNADEAFRVLNDYPLLSDHIGDLKVDDYQKVFLAGLKDIQRIIHEMAPHKGVMNFLWYKYDFHNLKVVLKARLMEHGYADIKHALIDMGLHSLENWEKVLFEGRSLDLIPGVAFAIKEATEAYEKSKDPQVVDLIVDQYYLDELNKLADEMESPLVQAYVFRLIDITNVRTFVRCKELKKDRAYFEKVIAKGGSVYPETFINAYDKGYDELHGILEKRPHMADLTEALDNVKKDKSLLALETKILENLQGFMKESQRKSFGPEPVFAFFYKFENHLQILRTIFIGKLNKLEVKEIAASLPAL
jgi:V/A-type H+-transporting ATPase subunit C